MWVLQRQSQDVSVAETVSGCECCKDGLWMWVLQRQSQDVSVAETVSGCECCKDGFNAYCWWGGRWQRAVSSQEVMTFRALSASPLPPTCPPSEVWHQTIPGGVKNTPHIYIYMDVRGKGNRSIHTLISTAVLCSLCTCENMALFGVSCIQSS